MPSMVKTEKDTIRVALDAMGGDNAPDSVLKGAELALSADPNLHFYIYGKESALAPLLESMPRLAEKCTTIFTDDIVSSDEKPSTAIRKGRNSSMGLAIKAAKSREVDCVVSAGNTGALMAMSKIILRTLPGIDRPAIGGIMPTAKGNSVMLDMGANSVCDANNLFEFAVMGDAFARSLFEIESPSIGLLNIGSEEVKGNEKIQHAVSLIKESELELNFHGFIEGNDIGKRTVDVVVTDGFAGNISLKTAEGTAMMIFDTSKAIVLGSLRGKIGALLLKPALKKIKKRFDPRLHNGAMFLGLNGIVIKSHGNSDALGNSSAIKVAVSLTRKNINTQIIQEMVKSGHIPPEEAQHYEEQRES